MDLTPPADLSKISKWVNKQEAISWPSLQKLCLGTWYDEELIASEKKIAFQGAHRMLGKKKGEGHVWLLTLESSDLFG